MRVKIITALGLAALLNGCGPEKSPIKAWGIKVTPSLEATFDNQHNLEIKTSLLEKKYHLSLSYDPDIRGINSFLERIDEVLSEIHPPLLGYLHRIEITNKQCNKTPANWCEGGLPIYSHAKTGSIQISPRRPFDSDLVAHTLVHIISAKNLTFQREWDSMIEIEPGRGEYHAIRSAAFPTRGFLSTDGIQVSYDSKTFKPSWKEDPAEYVAAIYFTTSPFEKVERHHESYYQKLDLLRDYDLISSAQYKRASGQLERIENFEND